MRVGIVGSRRRSSPRDREIVLDIVKRCRDIPDAVVISGGCASGADAFAERACATLGVPIRVYPVPREPPIVDRHDFTRRAHARNRDIAEDSDVLFALVAPERTGGTENTVSHALRLGKKVFLVDGEGKVYLEKDHEERTKTD